MTNDERELFDERVAIVAQSESEEVAQEVAREALERFRHQCEVNAVVRDFRERGGEFVRKHLEKVAHHRGHAAAAQLRADALAVIKDTK